MDNEYDVIYNKLLIIANYNYSNYDLAEYLDTLKSLDFSDYTTDSINFCIDKLQADVYTFKDVLDTFR